MTVIPFIFNVYYALFTMNLSALQLGRGWLFSPLGEVHSKLRHYLPHLAQYSFLCTDLPDQ